MQKIVQIQKTRLTALTIQLFVYMTVSFTKHIFLSQLDLFCQRKKTIWILAP